MLDSLVSAWTTPVLEGELVRLEPMTAAHEDGLWDASRDARAWQRLSAGVRWAFRGKDAGSRR